MKDIIVSGIQPTGELHLGNYLGAARQYLDLQNDQSKKCFFFIADYHSLTENYEPAEKGAQILNLAKDLLALGLSPKKCVFFAQSAVPEVTELAWIFNTLTPISFLEKMTQYKDKSARQACLPDRQAQNINAGLFDYPVLMAADVLLYHGTAVPVGEDQVQHLELARDIARFFNNRFGEYFGDPKPLLTKVPRLMSLTDPAKKMSKSLGPKSYIALSDSPETIAQKIAGVPTESTGRIPPKGQGGPEFAGAYNLLELLEIFGGKNRTEAYLKNQPVKYSELKREAAKAIADYFSDFRKARAVWHKKDAAVKKILAAGAKEAKRTATETMKEIRKRVGLA